MIGTLLRETRETKGVSIEAVEESTSIRRLYLEAIEKEDYDKLPGRVYARGFVRNYADFLGLDGDEIAARFKEEYEQTPEEEPENVEPAPPVKRQPAVPREETRGGAFSSGQDFKARTQGTSTLTKVMTAAAVVMVAFVGGIYYYFGNDSREADKVVSQPVPKQENAVIDVANPTASASGKVDGVEVVATFSNNCWTWVTSDGKDVFEGFVEKGQRLTWKGNKNVNVTLGNAGAVEIVRNGQSLGKAGKNGEVVEIRYTKEKAERVK